MMIGAAGPQIGDALVTRHEIKAPDGRIELLRAVDIRRFEIDAAQCRDGKSRSFRSVTLRAGECTRVIWRRTIIYKY